jgi:hypothetical protein
VAEDRNGVADVRLLLISVKPFASVLGLIVEGGTSRRFNRFG